MIRKRFFKTKNECEVTFELERPGAAEVELICSAYGWEPVTMKKAKGGLHRIALRVPVGDQVEFRYRVDGEWTDDPEADGHVPNRFGTTNGVVDTSPRES